MGTKMKIILTLALLLITACAVGRYMGEAEYEVRPIISHVQRCYFENDMILKRSNIEFSFSAGDTVVFERANIDWLVFDTNGLWIGKAFITLGDSMYSDTIIVSDTIKEHFTVDTAFVTVYHAETCTVSVGW